MALGTEAPSTQTTGVDDRRNTDLQPGSLTHDRLSRLRRWVYAYEYNKQIEINEGQVARKYYNCKQWTTAEIKKLKRRGQAPVFDNRIGRKIDFLVGVEQRMRRDPKAFPRTPQHEHSADTATACLRFVADVNRWEQLSSGSMHAGLVTGIGAVWVGTERAGDGENDVKIRIVPDDRFFYDPRSVLRDFSDARFMGVHLWLDIDEAKERYPDAAEYFDGIMDMSKTGQSMFKLEEDRAMQWGDFENRRVRIIEIYYRTLDKASNRDTWMLCTFCGERDLGSGTSPYTDEYGQPDCPYVAWSPYIDEQGNRYGVVRSMKPMQDEINHRRSKFLHLLNSRQLFVRDKGSVDDLEKLRTELARPDGIVETNGMKWGEDIGVIDASKEIQGQFELLNESQAALENLGPNPGLVGKGGGIADQSGRAILAQRDSGMTELSPVFEAQRDWKLRCYRKMWARLRQTWTGERMIRITDEQDSVQFLSLNQYQIDPMTGGIQSNNVLNEIDVDIILDEGPDTILMQEELLQTISQLGEAALGPMGKVIIELSNVPNKERLLKILDQATAPPPEVVEMQQRMARLEELLKAAQVDQAISTTEKTRADTISTLMTAFTPPQPQTNELGQVTSAPAEGPNMTAAIGMMQAFPLRYSQPTLEQQGEMIEGGMGHNEQAEPQENMMQPGAQPMPPGAPLPGQVPPPAAEQISTSGGLPVDAQFAGMNGHG